MKNILEGVNNRLNDTEEWISDLEYRIVNLPNQNSKNGGKDY